MVSEIPRVSVFGYFRLYAIGCIQPNYIINNIFYIYIYIYIYRIRVKTNARELKSKQRDAIGGSRVYTEMNIYIYPIKDVCPFYNTLYDIIKIQIL